MNSNSNEKKSLVLIESCNKKKANEPNIKVVKSWAILPRTVITTAWILLQLSKQKTLPPYSPILFGVKDETVIPEKIARKEVVREIFSNLPIINLHL